MFYRIESKSVFKVLSLSTDMQSSTDLYWWAPNQCIKLDNSTQIITDADLDIQAAERGNPGTWSVWLTSLKRCIRACYHIIYDNSAKSRCSNLLFLIMSLKHMLLFLESKFTCPVCSQRFTKLSSRNMWHRVLLQNPSYRQTLVHPQWQMENVRFLTIHSLAR